MNELQIATLKHCLSWKPKEYQYDIVVMVQGDEPMTQPEILAQAIKPFYEDSDVQVTNLLGTIKDNSGLKIVIA